MAHVFNVLEKEKMEKVCCKAGKDLLVKASVISLDKGPPSSTKMLV